MAEGMVWPDEDSRQRWYEEQRQRLARGTSVVIGTPPALVEAQDRIRALEHELADERAARRHDQERAYEHGLGDRAAVLAQNRVLAATVAALVDPLHRLNLPETR